MFRSKDLPWSLISTYKDNINSFYYLFDKLYNEKYLRLSISFIKPEYEKTMNCTKITELKEFKKNPT